MCPADETDEEAARGWALRHPQSTLTALVVNLIRVVRGAGKPALLLSPQVGGGGEGEPGGDQADPLAQTQEAVVSHGRGYAL